MAEAFTDVISGTEAINFWKEFVIILYYLTSLDWGGSGFGSRQDLNQLKQVNSHGNPTHGGRTIESSDFRRF